MEIRAGELKGGYDIQQEYIHDKWRPCELTCIACQHAIIGIK